ncbi:unnamed protein product [Schistosoma haematobium]|nr:unnamed protein product [Schistosoma haematobium]
MFKLKCSSCNTIVYSLFAVLFLILLSFQRDARGNQTSLEHLLMDNTNCSDVQLCQDVDNQLQICLTEELKSLHSSSETPPNHSHYSSQLNAVSHPAHTVSNQISVIGSKDQTSNSTVVQDDNFVADIELISLTSQRQSIPRYRLRVDPCTAFLGYRNKDFRSARRITRDFSSKYPLPKSSSELATIGYISSYTTNTLNRTTELNSEEDRSEGEDENDDTLSLTTEQIENTLDYFILCGLRVSQMAQTYEDLDAITQLLEEKQTDLELAAKIGKNLLAKNHDLQSRLLETEKNLNARDEVISQLNHNLSVKDNLLRIFLRDSDQITDINDDEVSVLSSGRASPVRSQQGLSSSAGGGDGFSLSSVNFAQLHKKLEDLEEENNLLRQERNRLSTTADQLDEHEAALVRDCARQLITANIHIRNLSDELAKKSDAFMNQQSEITRLLTRGLDLENRVKQLTAENEMLIGRLKETQISQSLLTSELKNSRDKYDECLTLYNEARLEIRALRKRSRRGYYRPNSLISCSSVVNTAVLPSLPPYLSGAALTPQSDPDPMHYCHHSSLSAHQLASDGSTSSLDMLTTQNPSSDPVETSLAADLVHARMKEHAKDNIKHLFRAMDQVRHTRTLSNGPTPTPTATTTINSNNDDNSSHNIILIESGLEDTVSSSGFVSGSEPSDNPHKQKFIKSEQTSNSGSPYSTRPFIPDFITPIRLADADRSKSNLVNYRFHQSTNPNYLLESEKRHSWLGCDVTSNLSDKGYYSIPDSGLNFQNSFDDSLLSCDPNVVCTSKSYCKLPQRLKLIKPLDGSNVLQHWQHLATPSFTRALFEAPLPGVQSRAGVSDSTNTNCSIIANTTDSRQRPVSVGSSPCISTSSEISLKCSSLTAHSPPDLPQGQPSMRFVQESLEKCTNLNRFGFNSSTYLLNNQLRARSLDHLVTGSPSLSYSDKNSNNDYKSIQFNQAFDHVKSDEPASSYLTSFSLTSLVSAILPFTTAVLPSSVVSSSDPKGVTINNKLTKANTRLSESTHLRPKCPSSSTAVTGLQGLLDVNKEDADSSKSLLHRTSTSKSIDRSALSPNSNVPNSIALPNPQPPTLISPSVNRTAISHSRPVRTSNLTEITEESGSPPKSENGQKSLISSENQQQQPQSEVVVVSERSKNSE